MCRYNCEIPWERVPYLSALEVCSWQEAMQIHVYLTLPYLTHINITQSAKQGLYAVNNTLREKQEYKTPTTHNPQSKTEESHVAEVERGLEQSIHSVNAHIERAV